MGHHHDDTHGEPGAELSFSEKGTRLLNHWIHHNQDHAQNYLHWAAEFRNHNFSDAAALLESAAEMTRQIDHVLGEALRRIETSVA